MRFFSRTIIFAIPFFLLSCVPKADTEGLKKAVEDYNSAAIEAMTTNNYEKSLSYFADDATEMPPNEPAIKGKENIKAWMEKGAQSGVKATAVKFTSLEVVAAGNIGYEIGDYDMTFEIPSVGEVKDVGKYIAIFKKQQDGSWKVYAETWNSNAPPPPPEPPKKK
jgi:ketosteroid isomerase-like protein